MSVLGFLLAGLMGLSLGLVGGGGALIAVPLLVYVFGVAPVPATGGSLLVVGLSALVGALGYLRQGLVATRVLLAFGLPSLATVWLARGVVLPVLPETIGPFGRDHLLMLGFAGLMLFAAWRLFHPVPVRTVAPSRAALGLQGLGVGLVTGLVGAGGGFLIVPALVLRARLSMNQAVATSLAIIAINCGAGLAFSAVGTGLPPVSLLLPFTLCALLGMGAGLVLAPRIAGEALRRGFALLTAAVGTVVLALELSALLRG